MTSSFCDLAVQSDSGQRRVALPSRCLRRARHSASVPFWHAHLGRRMNHTQPQPNPRSVRRWSATCSQGGGAKLPYMPYLFISFQRSSRTNQGKSLVFGFISAVLSYPDETALRFLGFFSAGQPPLMVLGSNRGLEYSRVDCLLFFLFLRARAMQSSLMCSLPPGMRKYTLSPLYESALDTVMASSLCFMTTRR